MIFGYKDIFLLIWNFLDPHDWFKGRLLNKQYLEWLIVDSMPMRWNYLFLSKGKSLPRDFKHIVKRKMKKWGDFNQTEYWMKKSSIRVLIDRKDGTSRYWIDKWKNNWICKKTGKIIPFQKPQDKLHMISITKVATIWAICTLDEYYYILPEPDRGNWKIIKSPRFNGFLIRNGIVEISKQEKEFLDIKNGILNIYHGFIDFTDSMVKLLNLDPQWDCIHSTHTGNKHIWVHYGKYILGYRRSDKKIITVNVPTLQEYKRDEEYPDEQPFFIFRKDDEVFSIGYCDYFTISKEKQIDL